MQILVGVGEYKISENPDDVLATFALASCVGVVMYCPDFKVMGMVHVMLPEASINREDSYKYPGKYGDIAVEKLYKELNLKYGVHKESIRVSVFGGLDSIKNNYFRIGERNVEAVFESIEKLGLKKIYTSTGGSRPRTLFGHVSDGRVDMRLIKKINKYDIMVK